MAASGTVTISCTLTGLAQGAPPISPPSASLPTPVYESLQVTLASGANTITVPAGASYVFITPPSGNTIGLTWKGVSADTGTPIHPTFSGAIPLGPGVTNFVLDAASVFSLPTTISFA